jgi:putative SOS response-associated peptidase YedK
MCFHSKQTATSVQLKKRFNAKFEQELSYQPNANINGFTHPFTPVITNQSPEEIQLFQWGLLPTWAKDTTIQNNTLNAKIETISEKPSFRESITKHCIIPLTGFYEWKWLNAGGTKKEKYLITTADNEIFSLAGLWNEWTNPSNGQKINTYTILTMEADELMAEIHNSKKRMPVILTKEGEYEWLYSTNSPQINHNLIASNLDAPSQMSLF